ncbi:taurine catabolism dioxygenase TauD [Elizabethkingia argentiflava]|uniref:Taurine catabolism dioxygenase TauD n=1 Tax=Elizabethkingia argenteiflava TaxID=2681556 RepID=A0A845PRZ2_9FLAO|nr:TauD/TfdA family dioxygenase [Elizabethkingia argenteiflava]NAW50435.1 taurine catabolism dioxygenase TauD [Elizabethkingia argenteiflava]
MNSIEILDDISITKTKLLPIVLEITSQERKMIQDAIEHLQRKYGSYENRDFITHVHQLASYFLPDRILHITADFASDFSKNQYGALIFKGLIDIDQESIGSTPPNWQSADYSKFNLYGFACALIHGALPSKPVQYYSQRKGGGLIHAIIPDEKMCETQTGSGSSTDLYVHTEDAFLKHQADFLSFMYVRNEEQVPSTLYSIRSHESIGERYRPLFERIYKIPKDANLETGTSEEDTLDSILYGNYELPFMRFDAAEQLFNPSIKQSDEAQHHLSEFWEEARNLIYSDFTPQAGDVIVVNNHLCAHGRSAFRAGIKNIDGMEYPCERRIMLRMMSKVSLIDMRAHTLTDDPFFIIEEHLGKNFKHF